jgi:hypothetical protein
MIKDTASIARIKARQQMRLKGYRIVCISAFVILSATIWMALV